MHHPVLVSCAGRHVATGEIAELVISGLAIAGQWTSGRPSLAAGSAVSSILEKTLLPDMHQRSQRNSPRGIVGTRHLIPERPPMNVEPPAISDQALP